MPKLPPFGSSRDKTPKYIELCAKGDASIPERAEIIFVQEKSLRQQLKALHRQMEVLKYKKHFYEELLAGRGTDRCNPANPAKVEPDIVPQN